MCAHTCEYVCTCGGGGGVFRVGERWKNARVIFFMTIQTTSKSRNHLSLSLSLTTRNPKLLLFLYSLSLFCPCSNTEILPQTRTEDSMAVVGYRELSSKPFCVCLLRLAFHVAHGVHSTPPQTSLVTTIGCSNNILLIRAGCGPV